jgi:transposase-like protein
MIKRRTVDQIQWLLREADRDLAKGLTVADVCRKLGVAENTYYRWRQRFNKEQIDDRARIRDLEAEIERLKKIVIDLMLDRQMLQDVAQKSGDTPPTARRHQLPE